MTRLRINLTALLSLMLISNMALESSALELAVNGGFETGTFNDGSPEASWQQFPGGGIQSIVSPGNGSTFAANLNVPVRSQTDPPVDNLIKNANLGIGIVTPGQDITIKWDMRGSLTGAGGVVFVELFSELDGGGVSKQEIYTNAPIFPTADWQSFIWNTTLGPDVAGGVTLQLKASCGPVEGCGVDAYFDNVSISVIPEPASVALLGLAGLALVGSRRRRNG
ncbi:PEP-CTERM sorting domain-containing protein [Bythopirellula polymerisocia]|uniref:Ice-binding protein C-terminal domain-containing protein n=1 Tax=Bythopirellula polymerisocia TaxID=2528003 RepID=A0A5C6D1W0_9BACT|nr:PEP-CTERM sorting domain-containing protein [Bythopirellula polymerisocia]TWU29824.1 hypothetical protein Pla144_06030 [Bythopirellula polymerisocia]